MRRKQATGSKRDADEFLGRQTHKATVWQAREGLINGWMGVVGFQHNAYLVAKPSSYTVATSSRVMQTAIYRNFPALRAVRKKTMHWKLDITHYNTYFTLQTNYGLDLYFQNGLRWRSLMD